MALSDRARAALFGPATDEVFLVFIDIDHDDLDHPLRFVNNTENIERDGQIYYAYPFQFILPDDLPDQAPRASIRISDVDPKELAELRELPPTEIRCSVAVAMASTPDEVEYECLNLVLNNIDADGGVIEGELSMSSVFSEPYPGDAQVPSLFPGLF